MSALQRFFVDKIFPDKAQLIVESKSNIGDREMEKPTKRSNVTSSESSPPSNKQEMVPDLQPVQHSIEQQFSTNYEDIFNSEEARFRISRLVEKQKKAHALSKLKSIMDDRSPSSESRRLKSAASASELNSNRSGCEKGVVSNDSIESNNPKRKVVTCQKAPSYKGFSETAAVASNVPQKKEAVNNSWNNSLKKTFSVKEEHKTKVCETSKESLGRNANIQSLKDGKRVIQQHLQQSKQSNSNQQVATKRSPPSPTRTAQSLGRFDQSPSRKHPSRNHPSPAPPSKVARIAHESDFDREPHATQNVKESSAQKHDVRANEAPGICKEDNKGRRQSRNVSKTQREPKKVSPPVLIPGKDDNLMKKTYTQEVMRKYITRRKDEKNKNDDLPAAIKKREGKQQTPMPPAQRHKESLQNPKKNLTKPKQDEAPADRNAPSTAWEEVFADTKSPKRFTEGKDAVHGTNGASAMHHSTGSSYEVSTKVSFATSYTRTTQVDLQPSLDKSRQRSNVRLQKLQEAARVLSSRLDIQATELISYFRTRDAATKNRKEASVATMEGPPPLPLPPPPPLPAALSTKTDTTSQTDLKSYKSQRDVSQSIPPGAAPSLVVSNPMIKSHHLQKNLDYFRVPDDLPKLNECILKEAELSKSSGAVMLGKSVENLPRDMFPSEDLRKKLSKKASLSTLESKMSSFNEAKSSKARLSFGSDSTFDEFNWKLIRTFLATEESRLMYQNSMSKLKRQALEDHSRSLSNIAEPSKKTRVFFKRGMDDVYPQSVKKSRRQSCPESSKESSEEVSSSCEIYSGSQMFTDATESSPSSELFKNVKTKKKMHELNLKLGERMLAKKEETLKQRKERLAKLLERLDSLDTAEREVNQMEIEISRRWKNFTDLQQMTDGKSGANKLPLKETAVQTNTSQQDVFHDGDCVSVDASIEDVNRTEAESAEVASENSKLAHPANGTASTEQQRSAAMKLEGKVEVHQDSPDSVSPSCNDSIVDKSVGYNHLMDFSLIFDQTPGFDQNLDFSTRNVCQKISKDSLEVDAENVNKEIKTLSSKSFSEPDDSLKEDPGTHLKESSKKSMSSETECISSVTLELSKRTVVRNEFIDELPWSCTGSKDNLENHLHTHTASKVGKSDLETSEQVTEMIDKKHHLDSKAIHHEVCASDRISYSEKSFSCESSISKDSLTASSTILHEVDAKPNNEAGSTKDHMLDSGDSLSAVDKQLLLKSKVSLGEEVEVAETEDISTEKTEITESGNLMKAIESAAAAVELFSDDMGTVKKEKETGEQLKQGPIKDDIDSKKSITTTNYITNEAESRIDWSKMKLGDFIVRSVAGDLLKDSTNAVFDAMKNKKRMLQKDSIELEDEVKEEGGSEALSDEYIDDDNYPATFPELKETSVPSDRAEVNVIASADIYCIPKCKDLTALISESLDIYWNQRRNGEPWEDLSPPIRFITKYATATPPESTFRTFIFELVGEVLMSLYAKEETSEEGEPQLEIMRGIADFLLFDRKNPIRKGLPNSLEELRPAFVDMILNLLPPRNDFIIARPTTANKLANSMCSKEGRDGHVENLLARELKLEEPDWVDYERDSESVKNSVADAIFKSLLDDTTASVLLAQSRKAAKCPQL